MQKVYKFKIYKKVFAVFLLAILSFFYSTFIFTTSSPLAFADSSTPSSNSQSYDLICSPNDSTTQSQYNFSTCLNNIYIFSISLGSFVAVLMFVLAGYFYMNGKESRAKEYISSTIFGLVLLFGSYIFLNFINPNLTNINVEPLSPVNCQANQCKTPTPSSGGTGAVSSASSKNLAGMLLSLAGQGKIGIAGSGDCAGNNPYVDLKDISAGQQAPFDGPGALCAQGYTDMSDSMLKGLIEVANNNLRVTVTSLTSGHHASKNDPHYAGRAVDFVPGKTSDINNIISKLNNNAVSLVAVECNLSSGKLLVHQYLVLDIFNLNNPKNSQRINTCAGKNGYHLHAQWGGASNTGG